MKRQMILLDGKRILAPSGLYAAHGEYFYSLKGVNFDVEIYAEDDYLVVRPLFAKKRRIVPDADIQVIYF